MDVKREEEEKEGRTKITKKWWETAFLFVSEI